MNIGYPPIKWQRAKNLYCMTYFLAAIQECSGHYNLVRCLLPIIIMSIPKGRSPLILSITCIIIVVGAWIKRYIIVVPTLLHPYMPIQEVPAIGPHIFPIGWNGQLPWDALPGIFLVITLFSKLFPMMAVWEVEGGVAD